MQDQTDQTYPANSVTFQDFCDLCEKLCNNKKNRSLQDNYLSDYINAFRVVAAQTLGENKNCSFFPILRLLLPKLDRERRAYELKEDKLGKLYVKILSLHSKSPDAQKLLNFRAVQGNKHGSDFASIAFFVLQSRAGRSGNLNIGQINEHLDKIANAEAGSKSQINYEVFTDVLVNTTPLQQKWWIRVILKDMKFEMGQNRILSCLHPDAPDHYEHYQNLLKTCEELEQGDSRPAELGVQLFCAVSPMLSERLDVTRLADLAPGACYQLETKFDGERFQVHMSNGVFGYFSRRGHSYTEQYGRNYESNGMLTPYLKDCFDPSVESFILDGEMMGWHKDKQCFSSKGMAFDVKKITSNSKFRACFCPFDVLYYNGRCLAGVGGGGGGGGVGGGGGSGPMPLSQRLQLLDALFVDVPGVIVHSKREIVKEREDILTALNKAIENEEEGIILKDVDSYYIANRRNAGWYKVKPEYTEGVMVDLDLMIVGADYAENKRAGSAKSFFLALAVAPEVPGEAPRRWVSVGRVASGLSHEQRERLCEQLARHWRPLAHHPPPDCLHFTKEKPDLWIHPEYSSILQVKASELIRSSHYAAGYTLRFPRIMRVRDDKPWKDAMTIEEMEKLVQGRSVEKLTARSVSAAELEPEARARRKRRARTVEVAAAFRAASAATAGGAGGGGALRGRKLCVLSGDGEGGKEELETLIVSHGGTVMQNIGSDTWCCVAGKLTARVRTALAAGDVDVATAAWLRRLPPPAPDAALAAPPPPLLLLAASAATRAAHARDYDSYGDSYELDTDELTLRSCFDKMAADGEELHLTREEMLAVDRELAGAGGAHAASCLRSCCMLVHGARSERLALVAAALGARVLPAAAPGLTHVLAHAAHAEHAGLRLAAPGAVLVSHLWLEACLASRCKVDETPYLISM